MGWPEVSIEDLPPRRDDEPASLRQDILDELTDHFACALNRELLKNSDKQLARQRVLNQFGDPIKIARQLWFDAMKEKIMSQKIMTGVSVVMAVCSIAVVGIAWMLMKESQGVNQSMLAQLTVIADRPEAAETAKMNQQILKQLDKLKQVQRDQAITDSGEMSQVSFQLFQNNKDKKPAVGFTGTLTKAGDQTDRFSVEEVSDQEGKLDFGKLPWGEYELSLRAPWGESSFWGGPGGAFGGRQNLIVIPGRAYSKTIVCPAAAPKKVPVQFQVNWSDKFNSEDWMLLCDFRDGGGNYLNREIDNANWSYSNRSRTDNSRHIVCLIDKNNKVSLCSLDQQRKLKDLDPDALEEKPSINLLESDYSLPVIYLIQKQDLKKLSILNSSRSYKVILIKNKKASMIAFDPRKNALRMGGGLGGSGGGGFGGGGMQVVKYHYETSILLPFKKIASTPDVNDSVLSDLPVLTKSTNGVLLPKRLSFSASSAHPNIWEIKLPDLNAIPVESGSLKKTK